MLPRNGTRGGGAPLQEDEKRLHAALYTRGVGHDGARRIRGMRK